MASGFQSQQTHIMIGSESAFGTEVATTTKVGTLRTWTPRNAWEILEVRGAGDGREVQSYLRTRYTCGGSLVLQLHDFAILAHCVGPKSGSGTSGAPYVITEADHTGVTSATQIVPFSMEVGSEATADDVDTYTGCFINDFSLQMDLGSALVGTFNIVAQKVTSSTTATSYTPLTTTPFIMNSGKFSWGATPTQVTGIRSATISYNNSLYVFGDWGTPLISMPETGARKIGWSVTCVMTASVGTAVRDEFYGQANSPVTNAGDMDFATNNEIAIVFDEGDSTGEKDATVALDGCVIENVSKPIDINSEDLVLVTFTGRATTSKTNQFVTWFVN